MRRALRACADAFAYFTVLPAGRFASAGAPDAYALSFLPLVGAIVGGIAGGIGYAAFVVLHVNWAFAVAWAAAIGLTGAIHVDGFLDACDGLLVTATPQRRLEIMTDPRHGTFAVVGMAVLTVFWLIALAPVPPERLPLVLAWSGALARLAVVPNAWAFPYARGGAMSATFASRPSFVLFALSFATGGSAGVVRRAARTLDRAGCDRTRADRWRLGVAAARRRIDRRRVRSDRGKARSVSAPLRVDYSLMPPI